MACGDKSLVGKARKRLEADKFSTIKAVFYLMLIKNSIFTSLSSHHIIQIIYLLIGKLTSHTQIMLCCIADQCGLQKSLKVFPLYTDGSSDIVISTSSKLSLSPFFAKLATCFERAVCSFDVNSSLMCIHLASNNSSLQIVRSKVTGFSLHTT